MTVQIDLNKNVGNVTISGLADGKALIWDDSLQLWKPGTVATSGTSGDSITVREVDSSPSVSDVTTIVFPNGTVTDNGDGVVTVSISGTSGSTSYSPDDPPSSPSAYDDEFNAALSGWTELGVMDACNANTDFPSCLHLQKTAPGSWTVFGVYKAIPVSYPFTITVKVSDMLWTSNYQTSGIMLLESGTGKIILYSVLYANAVVNDGYGVWNSRTSRAGFSDSTIGGGEFVKYLRIVATSATDLAFYNSRGGYIWEASNTGVNPGFTPAYMGLAISGQDSNVHCNSVFDFFRVT